MERKKVTITGLLNKKKENKPITMLTAYDFPLASIIDEAGIDMILVGDSVGMVVLGYENTLPVTMDDMLHHCKAVARGTKYAFLVGDMPFMSYQVSSEEAIRNAGRFVKEGNCDAVKLEGGIEVIDQIKAIVKAGIPAMSHIGLTPQSATQLGGFKVQGKTAVSAEKIIDDAIRLEKVGCFGIILECIPDKISKIITSKVKIPTIGIGAGIHCDGQVLVTYDILGLYKKFTPKFAKKYTDVFLQIKKAAEQYKAEVEERKFPAKEHSFTIDEKELKKLKM
ncbi:MAG: 3-methyl-2-oxobutanoate hydroxymethyltransferase [Candidatus Omnitrophota bacterium]|nr:MAG: 3-methyl-2-oxobutanoate hydroxymethyltransferase [Candidatus Omnitrophota bacterium]